MAATMLVIAAVAPGAARAAVATQFRVALQTPPRLTALGGNVAEVVLQPWEARRARALKAADPHLVVLVYQDFGSMTQGTGPGGLSSSGVGYAEARVAHPGWFLTAADGARVQESGYPYLWMADVGDPGYQRRWTRDVVSLLRRGPWDGVFMDDVNTTTGEAGPVAVARYETEGAYQGAVRSMLARVGPRIRAAGKLAIANVGGWVDHPAVVSGWLRYVDGAVDEKFAKNSPAPGTGYVDERGWLSQVRELASTQALHKRFFAITDAAPGDHSAQLYGWGSVLLGADGRASYLAASAYSGQADSIAAYRSRIGAPRGAMRPAGGGAWERRFADGLVVVNPTATAARVSFGATFAGSGLSHASSATLAPHTALVLTRVGGEGAPVPDLVWVAIALAVLLVAAHRLWRHRRRPAAAA